MFQRHLGTQKLGALLPDPTLLIDALDGTMKRVLQSDDQTALRVNVHKMQHAKDIKKECSSSTLPPAASAPPVPSSFLPHTTGFLSLLPNRESAVCCSTVLVGCRCSYPAAPGIRQVNQGGNDTDAEQLETLHLNVPKRDQWLGLITTKL